MSGHYMKGIQQSEFEDKVKEFKRDLIRAKLDQCSESQINLFNRMYVSIDKIEEDKMTHAYYQCKRTVEKNNE